MRINEKIGGVQNMLEARGVALFHPTHALHSLQLNPRSLKLIFR